MLSSSSYRHSALATRCSQIDSIGKLRARLDDLRPPLALTQRATAKILRGSSIAMASEWTNAFGRFGTANAASEIRRIHCATTN